MDFERLRKVLELEQSRNFANTAVSGGLDKFLTRYSKDHPGRIHLPYPSYKTLDHREREEWVRNTLEYVARPKKSSVSLDGPVTDVKGISLKLAQKFNNLGIITIRDLLYFFPRRHIDYSSPTRISELSIGVEQTVLVRVWQASQKKSRRGMVITEVIVGDATGTMQVTFFNQPYLAQKMKPNTEIIMSGKAIVWKGTRSFQPTSFEVLDSREPLESGQLIPVYSLTQGLYPRQVRRLVRRALDTYLPHLSDFLPEQILKNTGLLNLPEAIKNAHYPKDLSLKLAARRRLAFDELFLIQIGVLSKKRERQVGIKGITLNARQEASERFLDSLPFKLTPAQIRAMNETIADLKQAKPMSRLLHGDVGSGKTVVATGAMLHTVASGYQSALMAPTEILAEQHFENICQLLGNCTGEGIIRSVDSVLDRPIIIGLLTGSVRQKGKKELREGIASGDIDILIGTQALIQGKVEFQRLALVIVDEQHRFGVLQRLALKQKGKSPHMLVMSATPIPRTLALTLYGDLDISLIDELPPGRQVIKTKWLGKQRRQSGYNFVRKQVSEGRQAYVICPLVEESEAIDAKAATVEYERLSHEVFPDLRLGLLHGRMSGSEKDDVMNQFRAGDIDILVSTSVVEVGVDVPNATVMLVEGAERFGLSQLHQFRGRVWRSSHQGYCILLADNPSKEGRERLMAMESTHNGFILAERDLEMRGPGEFFGTRQSGLPDLKMARLTDVPLLELARNEAVHLFEVDPKLERPEHQTLALEVARLWASAENNR